MFTNEHYVKVFADRGCIKKELFDTLFGMGMHPGHGLKANMKNRLMPMWVARGTSSSASTTS